MASDGSSQILIVLFFANTLDCKLYSNRAICSPAIGPFQALTIPSYNHEGYLTNRVRLQKDDTSFKRLVAGERTPA